MCSAGLPFASVATREQRVATQSQRSSRKTLNHSSKRVHAPIRINGGMRLLVLFIVPITTMHGLRTVNTL